MPSSSDDNPIKRWITRMRRFGAVRKSPGMVKEARLGVMSLWHALKSAEKHFEDRRRKMERMERRKHGWQPGEEPPQPWRPW